MKTKSSPSGIGSIFLLATFIVHLPTFAQGTAFTYQGRLNDGANLANGSYDLTFAIFGIASGGTAVAGPLTNSATGMSNGLFTVLLDFGAGVFNGNSRWLEIGVQPAGSGAFTPLTSRQPITAAPYAIFAANTSAGGGSPWSLNGSNTFYNVGIGTTSPLTKLHVTGMEEGIRIDGPGVGAPNLAYMSFRDSNGIRIGYVGDGSTGDRSVFLSSDAGDVVLNTFAGRVLTATSSGTVKLGGGGQLLAPAGEENLRMIRGVVSGAGGTLAGSGFIVTHGAAGSGQYTVTFNTPFIGDPAVTATADTDGRVISTVGVTSFAANFQTRDIPSNSHTDAAFHFIAIGPR